MSYYGYIDQFQVANHKCTPCLKHHTYFLTLFDINYDLQMCKCLIDDQCHHLLCVRTCFTEVYEYCFTSLSVQSWQYRDKRKPEAGTMPYSYFEWLQEFFIVHNTIGNTVHSMPLNSLEQCICTTRMTNICPDTSAPVDTNEPSGPATLLKCAKS